MSLKGNNNVIVVEYIVQDCPIMGKTVVRHFIKELPNG